MKRPLLMVALLYTGGILLADRVALPLGLLLAASLGVGLVALFLPQPRLRAWGLGLLLVLTGASSLTWQVAPTAPDDLRHVVREDAAIVTLQGRLVDTPYHRLYEQHHEVMARTLAQMEVRSARLANGAIRPARGTVMVSTPGVVAAEFFGGKEVELEGVLSTPRAPIAPGQFDYANYLRRHGIHFQLSVASTNAWRLSPGAVQPARPPVADRFIGWAQGILARGIPADESMRLLWAMTLGWKSALTGDVSEPFMRSGTMHVFAISGLHIALIAGILVLVFRAARVPSHLAAWVVIPLIWFYTYATGWQASAIRSTVMMSVILAGGALRRPSDLLNSLAVAAFIILIWDPQQLFQAGFQLSFSVVLSLALFGLAFERWRKARASAAPSLEPSRCQRLLLRLPIIHRWVSDPLVPHRLRAARSERWRAGGRWVGQALTTSFAAWLGSIPLVAYYFNLVTPVSLLANLVVIPLSSAALAANMASLTVGALLPGLAELFNNAAWLFMGGMTRFSQWVAAWPGAFSYVSTPGWAFFGFYYGVLLVALSGWLKKPGWRGWAFGGVAGMAVIWGGQAMLARDTTRLTVLPLSGGDAICLDRPGTRDDALIDCGDEKAAHFVVKPFLRSQGINDLAYLALTHGDVRHVGGAGYLRQQFGVRQMATSAVSFRSPAYRDARGESHGTNSCGLQRGARLGLWTVLHPEAQDHFPQADDSSLVLYGTVQETRVLLLADLGKPGQSALLERNPELRADIVVSGIPGKSEPLAEALLDTLGASVIIVADSLFPATARASPQLRERLGRRNGRVLYTSETGGLTIVWRGDRWRIETARGQVVAEGPQQRDGLNLEPRTSNPEP